MRDIEIIGLPQSNFVWAVRIACAEKGVAHVNTPQSPHAPEVSAIHPLGRVPVMRHGPVTLYESRAICTYIDHAFEGPPLMPRDALARARAEQALSLIHSAIEPLLIRGYLFAYMFPQTPDKSPDRVTIDALTPEVERHLGVVERLVAVELREAGAFTLADAYLAPILFYLQRTPEAGGIMAASATLSDYLHHQSARSGFRDTAPPPVS